MRTYSTADRGYVRQANGVAPSPWLIVRTIFALGAAAAFAVASFSDWFGGIAGTDLGIRAFWRTDPGVASSLFQSAAIVTLALAVLTLLAMATVSGGLLRLTGALGLIAAFLIGVEMQRAGMNIVDTVQVGLWLIVAGGALALIAGFVPATRVVGRTTPQTGEVVNVDRDRTVVADDDDTVHVHDDPNVRTS
jgi:hypothetical protein